MRQFSERLHYAPNKYRQPATWGFLCGNLIKSGLQVSTELPPEDLIFVEQQKWGSY